MPKSNPILIPVRKSYSLSSLQIIVTKCYYFTDKLKVTKDDNQDESYKKGTNNYEIGLTYKRIKHLKNFLVVWVPHMVKRECGIYSSLFTKHILIHFWNGLRKSSLRTE